MLLNICMSIGAVIGFATDPDLGTVIEGDFVSFSLGGSGFSYGTISVQVTPTSCSDYPGDLSALFSNVPATSASTGMCAVGVCVTFLSLLLVSTLTALV